METIEQQALRMACDSFLSDYEGTPRPCHPRPDAGNSYYLGAI